MRHQDRQCCFCCSSFKVSFCQNKFVCNEVALCELVHDMEAAHGLFQLLMAGILV